MWHFYVFISCFLTGSSRVICSYLPKIQKIYITWMGSVAVNTSTSFDPWSECEIVGGRISATTGGRRGGVASNCRWGPRHQYVISAPVCHGQHGVSLKRSLSPESSVRRHTQCCVNGWWVWVQYDPPYTVLCEWVVGVGAIWPTLHSAVWMGGGCGCNMTHPTQCCVNGWWVWVQYDPPYTVLCEWVVGVGAIWPTLHRAVWMGGGCGCNMTHPTQCCVNGWWVWVQYDPPYTVLCEWVVGVGAIWPTLHSAVWMGGGCGCNLTHPTQCCVNGWWVWVQFDPPYTVLCECWMDGRKPFYIMVPPHFILSWPRSTQWSMTGRSKTLVCPAVQVSRYQ